MTTDAMPRPQPVTVTGSTSVQMMGIAVMREDSGMMETVILIQLPSAIATTWIFVATMLIALIRALTGMTILATQSLSVMLIILTSVPVMVIAAVLVATGMIVLVTLNPPVTATTSASAPVAVTAVEPAVIGMTISVINPPKAAIQAMSACVPTAPIVVTLVAIGITTHVTVRLSQLLVTMIIYTFAKVIPVVVLVVIGTMTIAMKLVTY